MDTVEIRLSNYQIELATTRLAYQRFAIRQLAFHVDPRAIDLANGTLASMEMRLATLLVSHASLLKKQCRPVSVFGVLRRSLCIEEPPLREQLGSVRARSKRQKNAVFSIFS